MSDLFGYEPSKAPQGLVRKILDADGRHITLIGFMPGKKCKDCANFYRVQYAKVYRRCKLFPRKNWKANEDACGSFLNPIKSNREENRRGA